MSKNRHSISKKQADKIIAVCENNTFEDSYEILGIKRDSLLKRLWEIKKKLGFVVSFDVSKKKLPKVLLFDIETTPMAVLVWGLFGNKYINHNNVLRDWHVLSWAGKWLFEEEIFGDVLTQDEVLRTDDSRIIKSIWEKINKADIVIAHNGDRFDIVKLNTRFLLNGLPPPNPYKSIDTLKVVKKTFKFSSNRLDYLGKIMENKQKIHTDFQLWIDCMKGDQESLDYMMKYNKMDIELLEDVYLELRPWIKSHPNMGLYLNVDNKHGAFACANCGDIHDPERIVWDGVYSTNVSQFKTFRCNCGAIIRTRNSHRVAPLMSVAY